MLVRRFGRLHVVLFGALAALSAGAQLRVVTWNITDYGGGRIADIRNVVYTTGRFMSADVFLVQEFTSATAVSDFLTALNFAPGSPGDWAAAPWVDGPDTDSMFFYRTSKVQYLGRTTVAVGGVSPLPPRSTYRFDIQPVGYAATSTKIACYNVHMKSSSAQSDIDRRLAEAQIVRTNAQTLGAAGWNFLIGGDFNIPTSTEAGYDWMVSSKANNFGRLFDPIKSPGNWNHNGTFKFLHSQDPVVSMMNDRYDQLLLSFGLIDGQGLDYIGSPNVAFSGTTWNDPNHSYRTWGNDGSCFEGDLTIVGNAMVGATVAQAIYNCANVGSTGGHIPVYLDLKVPGKASATGAVNFGSVPVGVGADTPLAVANVANTALWTTNGIAPLNYTMTWSGAVTAPDGGFSASAGAAPNNHLIALNTATPGMKTGTVTVNSNDPDSPSVTLNYIGEVYQYLFAASFSLFRGSVISGGLADLQTSNDSRLVLRPGSVFSNAEAPVQMLLNTTAPSATASVIRFICESHSSAPNITQNIWLYNYSTAAFEEVDSRTMSTSDSTVTYVSNSNASRFIDPATHAMQAKITGKANGAVFVFPWQVRIDQAVWTVTP